MPNIFDITDADKLSAHIHSDYAIGGTGLTGFNIVSLIDFITILYNNLATSSPISYASLGAMLPKLAQIKETHSPLLERTMFLKAQSMQKTHDYIAAEVKRTGACTFYAGWSQFDFDGRCVHSYGHAMIAELRTIPGQDYVLLFLYNSSFRAKFHGYIDGYQNQTEFCARVWQIPQDQLEQNGFKSLLSAAWFMDYESNINHSNYSKDNYYSNLEMVLKSYNATEVDPQTHNITKIKGQISSTCTWKCLTAFMKNQLQNEAVYRLLKYDLKYEELTKYFSDQLSAGRLIVPHVREHLRNAVNNLERLIWKLDSAPEVINFEQFPARRECGLNLIAKVRAELTTTSQLKPIKSDVRLLQQNLVVEPLQVDMQKVNAEIAGLISEPQPTEHLFMPVELSTNSEAIYSSLNKLNEFIKNEKYINIERLLVLESFVQRLTAPLPESLLVKTDLFAMRELIDNLADLSSLHVHLCAMQGENCLRYESLLVGGILHWHLCNLIPVVCGVQFMLEKPEIAQGIIKRFTARLSELYMYAPMTDPRVYAGFKLLRQAAEQYQKLNAEAIDLENLYDLLKLIPDQPAYRRSLTLNLFWLFNKATQL